MPDLDGVAMGVLRRRGVAAADMAALGAAAEMEPPAAGCQALDAAGAARAGWRDRSRRRRSWRSSYDPRNRARARWEPPFHPNRWMRGHAPRRCFRHAALGASPHEHDVHGHDQRRHPRLEAGLDAVRAAEGARRRAQRRLHRARRRRLLGDELLRRPDRDPEHRQDRGRRRALHAVAHDGALLADALVPADRPQPHSQQHGLHHRGARSASRTPAARSRPRTGCSPRSSASAAGTPTWSASGTSAPTTR